MVADLSGMSQSMGYLLASIGPMIFGWTQYTLKNSILSFVFLQLVLLIMLFSGLIASDNKKITYLVPNQ